MNKFLKNYSLSLALFLLFISSIIGQYNYQWQEYKYFQESHFQPIKMEEFYARFWGATLENWQAEFLQLLAFILLSYYFIHRGSQVSRDSYERLRASLDRIERKIGSRE